MKRKGEAYSGRVKAKGLAPVATGLRGRTRSDSDAISSTMLAEASTSAIGVEGRGEVEVEGAGDRDDAARVTTAEGSTEMRSPGCNLVLGSVC
jgi:hypothetical protein